MTTDNHDLTRWKQQLFVVWIAQFLAIASFAFGLPFAAYYIQDLGITDPEDVLFWTAVFQGAAPVAFCFAAPFWGAMADRFGRKPMLVRANICAGIVLLGMGLAANVYWLIAFRVAQGLFTGTIPAAQTLVTVSTPQQRQGMALGALSAAIFAGVSTGFALGGWTAEHFGYRSSFYIGAALATISAGIIAVASRERFAKPEPDPEAARPSRFASIMPGLPLLLLVAVTASVMHIELPVLPLVVQELNGGLKGAATIMGNLGALGAIAAMIGGMIWGALADRVAPTRLASICAVLAAACCIPFALAFTLGLPWLYGAKFGLAFFAAGLDPVFQVWLSKVTPSDKRGAVFGWASTARSLGWMFGPLGASGLAAMTTLTTPYWVMAVGYLLLIPVALWAARAMTRRTH